MRPVRLALLSCSLLALSAAAHATPIVYVLTATGTGTYQSAFTNQTITLTGYGDTSNIKEQTFPGAGNIFSETLSSLTIQVGSGPVGIFSDAFQIFDNQFNDILGFDDLTGNSGADILDVSNAKFASYALATSGSGSGGLSYYRAGETLSSNLGTFALSSASGPVSYSATLTPALTPTPEPSSIALLGTGLVGVIGAARRRFRKA